MTDLGQWASILFFPACVIVLAAFLLLVQRRTEARWAREALEHKNAPTPAE